MKNENTNYAPAVNEALNEYNKAVDMALDAVQKLESIYVTEHLVKLFGTNETQAAKALEEDYLVAA